MAGMDTPIYDQVVEERGIDPMAELRFKVPPVIPRRQRRKIWKMQEEAISK